MNALLLRGPKRASHRMIQYSTDRPEIIVAVFPPLAIPAADDEVPDSSVPITEVRYILATRLSPICQHCLEVMQVFVPQTEVGRDYRYLG